MQYSLVEQIILESLGPICCSSRGSCFNQNWSNSIRFNPNVLLIVYWAWYRNCVTIFCYYWSMSSSTFLFSCQETAIKCSILGCRIVYLFSLYPCYLWIEDSFIHLEISCYLIGVNSLWKWREKHFWGFREGITKLKQGGRKLSMKKWGAEAPCPQWCCPWVLLRMKCIVYRVVVTLMFSTIIIFSKLYLSWIKVSRRKTLWGPKQKEQPSLQII